jgi:hypothetical protein
MPGCRNGRLFEQTFQSSAIVRNSAPLAEDLSHRPDGHPGGGACLSIKEAPA